MYLIYLDLMDEASVSKIFTDIDRLNITKLLV